MTGNNIRPVICVNWKIYGYSWARNNSSLIQTHVDRITEPRLALFFNIDL